MTNTILRLPAVLRERGRSRSAHYFDIQQGLFTHPVQIGLRAVGWPTTDVTQGLVRLSHHVAGWENVPLADWLEDEFGVPVIVDNDANAAALGELSL